MNGVLSPAVSPSASGPPSFRLTWPSCQIARAPPTISPGISVLTVVEMEQVEPTRCRGSVGAGHRGAEGDVFQRRGTKAAGRGAGAVALVGRAHHRGRGAARPRSRTGRTSCARPRRSRRSPGRTRRPGYRVVVEDRLEAHRSHRRLAAELASGVPTVSWPDDCWAVQEPKASGAACTLVAEPQAP